MQLQRKREKKKKIIKEEEVEANDDQTNAKVSIAPSTLESLGVEEPKEELNSWEDLHQQVFEIEKMYPSAPIDAIIQEPEKLVQYPPLLTMDLESSKSLNYDTVLSDHSLLYYPSDPAPLLQPSAPLQMVDQDQVPTAPKSEVLIQWRPMPPQDLEKIHTNSLESEHQKTLLEFQTSNLLNDNDPFYRKLMEYELSFIGLDASRRRIENTDRVAKDQINKCWTIKRVCNRLINLISF